MFLVFKKCCFFAPKMKQEMIKVPCFQKMRFFAPKMNQEAIKVPWAPGPMDPWAHGPMGPWAHEVAPRSRTTKPITFFPKLSIVSIFFHIFPYVHGYFSYIFPICPWLSPMGGPMVPLLTPEVGCRHRGANGYGC